MLSMNEQSPTGAERRLERAILLVLLSEKDESRCSCAQLARALEADVQALEQPLGRLSEIGLINRAEDQLWASRVARYVDELGLIAI
jgi:predicted transcriptional regulator